MKKLVCLLVALILCVSCVAMASAASSKTTNDMTNASSSTSYASQSGDAAQEDAAAGFAIYLVTDDMVEHQDLIDIAKKEIEKLAASESVEAYFGEVKDVEGNVVDLKAAIEAETLNVNELYPVVAAGYTEELGDVTVKFLFSTPYAKDEKVAVNVGLVTVNADGTQSVEWKTISGIGVEAADAGVEEAGAIEVVLDPQTVLAIQEGTALLALVSK